MIFLGRDVMSKVCSRASKVTLGASKVALRRSALHNFSTQNDINRNGMPHSKSKIHRMANALMATSYESETREELEQLAMHTSSGV